MQDESDKESQKSDKEEVAEEDVLHLDTLDDEFFVSMNDKIKQIIDSLEKRELNKYAEEVQVLLTVCNKVRDEWLGNEQKTKNAIIECNNMREQFKELLDNSRIDKDTIEKLKIEIEHAWKQTDAAQLREQAVQEKNLKLNEKVEKLENLMQKHSQKGDDFISFEPEIKENLLKEREKLSNEIKEMKTRLQQQKLHTNEVEKLNNNLEGKLKDLHQTLENNSMAILKEKKLVESLTKEKLGLIEENKSIADKLKAIEAQNELCVKTTVQQNLKMLAQKTNYERICAQYNETSTKLTKVLSDFENLKYEKENLTSLLEQKTELLKAKEEENLKFKTDYKNYSKLKDSFLRKFQLIEKDKILMEKHLVKLKNEYSSLEKEQKILKKNIANLNLQLNQTINERDIIKNQLINEKNQINNYEEEIKLLQQQIKNLNNNLNTQKLLENKQLNNIKKIQAEKDKNCEQVRILENKVSNLQDEIYLKNSRIMDLKKDILEYQNNISNIQAMLETMRDEKISMEENLLTSTQEKENLIKQLELSNDTVKNLKTNIKIKKQELFKCQANIDRLEKEYYHMKKEIANLHETIQSYKSEIKDKKQENNELNKTLAENKMNFNKLKKEYDQCTHEKNSLHSQLTKCNEDLILQKQQIETLKINNDKEKLNNEKCLNDIHKLQIKVRNLESKRDILKRNQKNSIILRTEVVELQRNLNQEMIKSKSLENEMVTPLNMHRWRYLAGKDPEKIDLINRIQVLQKTILSQHAKFIKCEDELQYSYKLYETLKEFMLKLPSYKIQEQLNRTQNALTNSNKQIKALLAELNAKDTDDKVKTTIVEDLRNNLQSAKRQLIDEKKRKQELLEERQIIEKMQLQCLSATSPYTKTIGSGFKMSFTA